MFIRRVLETIAPAEVYQHNWHIEAMAWHLQLVKTGQVTRLLITVPPRHLRSICVSVAFVAWMLESEAAGPRLGCFRYTKMASTPLRNRRASCCDNCAGTRLGRR